jgi:quercetin 2,3-dioxygenase
MQNPMKKVSSVHRGGEGHWVGDGFPVRTIFHYQELGHELTPFLLLDHAGPADFEASDKERGVGWHPHRGFETVSIAFEGAVDHEDSAGHSGTIGPGDVQWMTAGAGVLHKEMHAKAFAKTGGRFHMLQLWVNLPAKLKMTPPHYQTLLASQIPSVPLPDGAGEVRVIAGEFAGAKGPAHTFTDINLFDVRLSAKSKLTLDLTDGHNAGLFVMQGSIVANGQETAHAGELVVFKRDGAEAVIEAAADSIVLVMNGEPIDEPIAGYGPFVMNTPREIQQAFVDMREGTLGKVPALTS